MNIGLVVYSQTGNTLEVVRRLQEKLAAIGHKATIERVGPTTGLPAKPADVSAVSFPDLGAYEALVLAAPVQAFSLVRPMAVSLKDLPALQGRKVACLTTHQLTRTWMGGSQAIRLLAKSAVAKGGAFAGSGIVSWSAKDREQQIASVVDHLANLF
jgi:NAD(P)H dehydrogenase (quinone)